MTGKDLENIKEEVIVDAGGTEHNVKKVENDQTENYPRPCKCCGKDIVMGWEDIQGYCRKCWNSIRKGSRPLESFEK